MVKEIVAPGPRPIGCARAAEILGCSKTHVRNLVRRGKLRADRRLSSAGRPRLYFDQAEVLAIRTETAELRSRTKKRERARGLDKDLGEAYAAVFLDLRAHRSLADIVVDRKLPAPFVREARAEYLRTFEVEDADRKRDLKRRADVLAERQRATEEARRTRDERAELEQRRSKRLARRGLGVAA